MSHPDGTSFLVKLMKLMSGRLRVELVGCILS